MWSAPSEVARLVLPRPVATAIEAEARAALPAECCGLLVGTVEGDAARIERAVPSRNLAGARDRFEVDPALRIALMREMRAAGCLVIGHYHSHPEGPARPSPVDEGEAQEAGLVWLILGLGDGYADFAAFQASSSRMRRLVPITLQLA